MKKILYLFFLTAFLFSCKGSDVNVEPPVIPVDNTQGGTVKPGRTEIPRLHATSADQFINHATTLNGQNLETYCMEYNYVKFHARWVAYYMTASNSFSGSGVIRSDKGGGAGFVIEPDLPIAYQTDKKDYNPTYTRGHLCPSADRFYSQAANNQTFYYSNMSPQLYDFNGGIWMYLEAKVRKWGYNRALCDTLFIVKGGTINKEEYIQGYTVTGTHKVAVPKYYYVALLAKKGNNYHAIGFILEHRTDYPTKNFGFRQYAMTITELEKRTDIDFFPNLEDNLEKNVEGTIDPLFWPDLDSD